MNPRWTRIVVAAWLTAWAGQVCAQSVDAHHPEEWREMRTAEHRPLPRWLPHRIRQLEAERAQLLDEISTLPQFNPALIPDRLGYHSGYTDQDGGPEYHQLTVHFTYRPHLGAVALIPAINPRNRYGDSYAFPRRFRIELQESKGVWSDLENQWVNETFRWVDLANWWEEDFPAPGRYPVFFTAYHTRVAKVRITVPRGTQGAEQDFFALGELFLFQSVEDQVADNMSMWGPSSIEKFEVSDSFSLPPFWDLQYMYDGFTGLGVPLSEERVDVDDFIVHFDDEEGAHGPARIMLDLGRVRQVGLVEFWAMEAPGDMAVPMYAFPGKILVELSSDPDFSSAKTIVVEDARKQMYHDNLLRVMCGAHEARYIRLTMDDLFEENGRRMLGFGEISVSEHGKVFSEGCTVSATGIPAEAEDRLFRLVDGYCRQRRIVPETEWVRGLARRRPLDRRLAVVERSLGAAREAWAGFKLQAGIWGGGLLCFSLFAGLGLQRLQRQKVLKQLKHRITRDLHDEVGSSLGGLSLTSEGLEEMAGDAAMKEELSELSLMAREACASLREVVWVTDQGVIRLPALVGKMVERAERVLRGVEVVVDVSPALPDVEVSLSCKRHLIMCFREAIHNCARHAAATQVRVSARMAEKRLLELSVQDDGRGFDPSQVQKGWGLDSMKRRVGELEGALEIRSAPGEGTLVHLTLPLRTLSREPAKAYKTSN